MRRVPIHVLPRRLCVTGSGTHTMGNLELEGTGCQADGQTADRKNYDADSQ